MKENAAVDSPLQLRAVLKALLKGHDTNCRLQPAVTQCCGTYPRANVLRGLASEPGNRLAQPSLRSGHGGAFGMRTNVDVHPEGLIIRPFRALGGLRRKHPLQRLIDAPDIVHSDPLEDLGWHVLGHLPPVCDRQQECPEARPPGGEDPVWTPSTASTSPLRATSPAAATPPRSGRPESRDASASSTARPTAGPS
eukprot:CAMPEP_0175383422 /NCGR_PEP_ID=MMETSP0095-20121207/27823_1 /TAXON_ID=311494 /ORGANISM="Alexandrium monilatum, Strain CCMP3105" /LENGTH=194 /DNA_ID=CAMNT_0016681817 /DNA_START=258 /DNA_END=838 /DNA_ORIENTATION=-